MKETNKLTFSQELRRRELEGSSNKLKINNKVICYHCKQLVPKNECGYFPIGRFCDFDLNLKPMEMVYICKNCQEEIKLEIGK